MSRGSATHIESLHPQQRHTLKTFPERKPEFVGNIEDMDVFWLQGPPTVIIKFSGRDGDCWWLRAQEPDAVWSQGYRSGVRAAPTAEQLELALVMCKCFAQTGRLPEWDEEVVG
jgi:hypothetical protein